MLKNPLSKDRVSIIKFTTYFKHSTGVFLSIESSVTSLQSYDKDGNKWPSEEPPPPSLWYQLCKFYPLSNILMNFPSFALILKLYLNYFSSLLHGVALGEVFQVPVIPSLDLPNIITL